MTTSEDSEPSKIEKDGGEMEAGEAEDQFKSDTGQWNEDPAEIKIDGDKDLMLD
jgi:hypothetical protein